MGGACSADGGEERLLVLLEKPQGKNHLGDPGADGMILLRWILRKWDGGMDWIDVTQDRDRWWAIVNTVRNLRVP
jgi:hypothetical protein